MYVTNDTGSIELAIVLEFSNLKRSAFAEKNTIQD